MIAGLLLGLLIALVSSGTTFIVMLYRHEDGGRGRWPDELPPWLLPSLDDLSSRTPLDMSKGREIQR